MNHNPFSIYDFLGYLLPGAFCLMVVNFILYTDNPLCPYCFMDSIRTWVDNNNGIIGSIFFIIISYITGHAVAYFSSLTIEFLAIKYYGYPSAILMGRKQNFLPYSENRNCVLYTWFWKAILIRTVLIIAMLPLFILVKVLGDWMGLKRFYIKSFHPYTKRAVNVKIRAFVKHFKLKREDIMKDDYHRLISSYVYETSSRHGAKMDNYVALYDFMRAISCIFNFYTWYVIIVSLYHNSWSISSVCVILFLMLITYLFFMAYIKFFRRYTQETLICLVTDKDIIDQTTYPRNYSYTTYNNTYQYGEQTTD